MKDAELYINDVIMSKKEMEIQGRIRRKTKEERAAGKNVNINGDNNGDNKWRRMALG